MSKNCFRIFYSSDLQYKEKKKVTLQLTPLSPNVSQINKKYVVMRVKNDSLVWEFEHVPWKNDTVVFDLETNKLEVV